MLVYMGKNEYCIKLIRRNNEASIQLVKACSTFFNKPSLKSIVMPGATKICRRKMQFDICIIKKA